MEYTGERISHDEADDRYGEEHEHSPHTMLFAVDDEVVIDATRHGSSARFINHSCGPNCEAIDEEGRIYIETLRDIKPGEELVYDYGIDYLKNVIGKSNCLCSRCRRRRAKRARELRALKKRREARLAAKTKSVAKKKRKAAKKK